MNHFTNQSNGSHRGHSLMGRAMIRRFALFPMMLLMLLLLPDGMMAQKAASSSKYIATYNSTTQTLTFRKYTDKRLPNMSAWVEDNMTVWAMISNLKANSTLGNIDVEHIVFDQSFSTFTPTTLKKFFSGLTYLETIQGLEYLNTTNVTDMSYMFSNCMFIQRINATKIKTEKVTNMEGMFQSCKTLTSLDLSNFNTGKVTNMKGMFRNSDKLEAIIASNKFVTNAVTASDDMFKGCKALYGDIECTPDKAADKTYAKIDGGYFRMAGVADRPWAEYADGTLTFRYGYKRKLGANEYELNSAGWTPDWTDDGKASDITTVVFDASFANARPTSCYMWFRNFAYLTQIKGIENLNTEKVTNMYQMFCLCSSLKSLDVTHFNTANVTNMNSMFDSCDSLASLDVTHFNTEKVTDMGCMFSSCMALESLDVTHFNTENVTIMGFMFGNCRSLTKLDVTHFNTEKVTDMSFMFSGCKNLKSLDVTHFNTANVTNMRWMFNFCPNLTSLDVTHFNTAEVKDMSCMFNECDILASLDVTHFNTAKVTDMNGMFSGCKNLKSLDVTHFNTANVTNMADMFSNCSSLTSLDLSSFNTEEVTYMAEMFFLCYSLATIYVSDKFVTSRVTNGNLMFSECKKLKGFLEYKDKTENYDHYYANYKTGYFTKLVGKNGDERFCITGETKQLTVDNLTLADDKDFVAYEPFAAKAASYSRTVEGTTWATLCLPFEVSLQNQNFRAFKLLSADDDDETVELEEIKTSIEAGTPVIIKMNEGATLLSFSEANKEIANEVKIAETANGNYQLQGLYTQKVFSKDADNNCYIVKGDKLMNPAKLLEKTETKFVGSKPFRAYMVDKSSAPVAGARMFSIRLGDGTTGIKQLEADTADAADSKAEYYDLQGHRLQDLQKGVNIVKRGGKTMKVVIK